MLLKCSKAPAALIAIWSYASLHVRKPFVKIERTRRSCFYAVAQQRPDDARHLGGERYHGGIGMGSREQPAQLVTKPCIAGSDEWRGVRSLDQHLAQVFAPTFGDAEKLRLAAGRGLPRHQTQPGGEVSASGEGAGVADRSHECSGIERANAGNAHQPLNSFGASYYHSGWPPARKASTFNRTCARVPCG